MFRSHLYSLGDTLYFKETDTTSMIGRLIRIIPEGADPENPFWPMIEVQWYEVILVAIFIGYIKRGTLI